ncbi:MAG: hypothetical protein LUD68_01500 [Rikenellaceae bacterium]|nr:hypothetical protein [Rikenellaceae bacterium]
MKKRALLLLFFGLLATGSFSQTAPEVEMELREYLNTLAGEEMAGRAAESQGDTLAMEYLRHFLARQEGIRLLYDNGV